MQAATVQAVLPASSGVARRPVGRQVSALRLMQQQRRQMVAVKGLGDGKQPARKGIKREDEPDEYWSSKSEREGKSPFQDPLAQIGILAIFFPFIFLAFAIAFGWVDLSGGRM